MLLFLIYILILSSEKQWVQGGRQRPIHWLRMANTYQDMEICVWEIWRREIFVGLYLGASSARSKSAMLRICLVSWLYNLWGLNFSDDHDFENDACLWTGLPAPHMAYIKNIDPGLTLFLFNYSDRTLHGIFEAASEGKLNIDSKAWSPNGTDPTPYPAQVPLLSTERLL